MKTEASAYSIEDLRRDGRTQWDGVRNYWARNFMQAMKVGDLAIVYHSNASPSGAAGLARVCTKAYPDGTAFNVKDSHYDAKSNPEKPTWFGVDVEFVEAFPAVVSLARLQENPKLDGMMLLSGKSMRLSVQPLEKRHFDVIVKLGRKGA